ncbi:RNA polymerase sigma factor [bacterium]|nr:MAG: RNA polymerase sigma factor [bacterium]
MNDLQTARLIAAGDGEAAEKLVRDHYPSVFRAMRHLTGHREDAEDLTQQAFLVAREKIHTFRGSSGLKTWIHRIAFNEYAQWNRKRRQTTALPPDQQIDDPGYRSFVAGESLLSALRELTDKHRVAFVLHEVEEMKVEEVARVLRVPTGTVKARLFYARRRLRALLEEGTEVANHEPKEAVV